VEPKLEHGIDVNDHSSRFGMWASMRRYEGITDPAEAGRLVVLKDAQRRHHTAARVDPVVRDEARHVLEKRNEALAPRVRS
jgi:hypothetical protein